MDFLQNMRGPLEVLVLLITSINTLVLFLRKPGQDAIAAVAKLREEVDERHAVLATEHAVLIERIKHMPTNEELAELAGNVQALGADMRGLVAMQKSMSVTLNRIDQYMMNNK